MEAEITAELISKASPLSLYALAKQNDTGRSSRASNIENIGNNPSTVIQHVVSIALQRKHLESVTALFLFSFDVLQRYIFFIVCNLVHG